MSPRDRWVNHLRRNDGEEGAALIIALIFTVVWSVAVFAVVDFSAIGFETAGGAHERTEVTYAADAAAEIAIEVLADDPAFDCEADGDPIVAVEANGIEVVAICTAHYPMPMPERIADLTVRDGGDTVLRARVRFEDPDDEDDEAVVTVTHWMVFR